MLAAGQTALHFLLIALTTHDHPAGSAPVSVAAMVAAHAVVTLLVAVSVCHADAAITALVGALLRVLPHRSRVAPVDVPLPTRPVPDIAVSLRATARAVAAHARRGPPILG